MTRGGKSYAPWLAALAVAGCLYGLAGPFGLAAAGRVRERRGAELDAWLEAAKVSDSAPLRRFAAGLCRDLDAVRAGLSEPWSNGQTEGQIHRLKLLKRQMYGRAGFAVLRNRVLLAA